MRHLGSLIAGILIAPVAWCLIALGQARSAATVASWIAANQFDTKDLVAPAAYLAAAGVLIGLIATLRISPVGPLVAGLLYTGTYVGLFFSPLRVRDAVPGSVTLLNTNIAPRIPLDNGTLLLVGVTLLIAVFSAARWRGRTVPPAETAAPAVEPVDVPAPETEPYRPYQPDQTTVAPAPGFGEQTWSAPEQRSVADTDQAPAYGSSQWGQPYQPAPRTEQPALRTEQPAPRTEQPALRTEQPASERPTAAPSGSESGSRTVATEPEQAADQPQQPQSNSPWSTPPPRTGQG
jgi:hypothetical protein